MEGEEEEEKKTNWNKRPCGKPSVSLAAYPSNLLRTQGVPTAVGIPEKEKLRGLSKTSFTHPCGSFSFDLPTLWDDRSNCQPCGLLKRQPKQRNRSNYLSRAVRSARLHRLCRTKDGNKARPLPSLLYPLRGQGRFERARRPWTGKTESPASTRLYTEETASGKPSNSYCARSTNDSISSSK